MKGKKGKTRETENSGTRVTKSDSLLPESDVIVVLRPRELISK